VLTEQRSYYSSFKPRTVALSNESQSQVQEVPKNTVSQVEEVPKNTVSRERISSQSIKTSGSTKVFTFDLS
jgi:hypothetical protein